MVEYLHKTIRSSFAFFLAFALAIWVSGCAGGGNDPELPVATGSVALQTSSGDYELQGSVSFTRNDDIPYSVTEGLGTNQQSVTVPLPIGSYVVSLVDYRLIRRSDSADVTHRIPADGIDIPSPVLVESDKTTPVTITIRLNDGPIVVFGLGSAEVTVGVDDETPECGDCEAGQACFEHADGSHSCERRCTPENADAECGAGIDCLLVYVTEAADGTREAVRTCSKNLFPDGDFEDDWDDPNYHLGWYGSRVASISHTGNYSLGPRTFGPTAWVSPLPVAPGAYTFSMWALSNTATLALPQLSVTCDATTQFFSLPQVDMDGGWVELTGTFDAGQCQSSVGIWFSFYFQDGAGNTDSGYIDDATLTRID